MSKETENILRFAALIAVFLFIMGVALFRIRGLEKELDAYKNAPGFGKHQWYLPTIEQVGRLAALTHTFIVPKNWNATYYWSSTQYSKGFAWGLNSYSYLYDYAKYNSGRVVPCADLILNT